MGLEVLVAVSIVLEAKPRFAEMGRASAVMAADGAEVIGHISALPSWGCATS